MAVNSALSTSFKSAITFASPFTMNLSRECRQSCYTEKRPEYPRRSREVAEEIVPQVLGGLAGSGCIRGQRGSRIGSVGSHRGRMSIRRRRCRRGLGLRFAVGDAMVQAI